MEFNAARELMIETQVRPNDVTDRRIHDALRKTPREAFLPRSRRALAYSEAEIETSEGRFMWRPRDFAKLLQAAEIDDEDLVLDIAPGAGYSSAILARLASAVVGLEADEEAATKAGERLADLGVDNAVVVAGDLAAGLAKQGPYNVIFVNGSIEEAPDAWFTQLAEGGRLAAVMREGRASRAKIFTKTGEVIASRTAFDAAPPRLDGFERKAGFAF